MDLITIALGILGLIATVLIALIPYFRRVYFVGPELTIELLPHGGTSGSRGLSHNNDTSKGYIVGDKAIHIFEVTWNIHLKITNNSDVTAYYPELKFINEKIGFTSLENLDKNSPVEENEKIVLKGTYTMFEEVEGKNRTEIRGLPDHLKEIKILLKYKNPSKRNFYTLFVLKSTGGQNTYLRRIPKEFKNKI